MPSRGEQRVEMAERVAAFDWASTPLGPMPGWPTALRTIVDVMLHSRHPMFLWWGPELIQIYNDAYVPSFGRGKHPAALGQRGADCWQEIWPIIWPQIEGVMTEARPTWNEDHLVPIFRNGRIEEVYWTYGYSPVFADDGRVGGTLVVCTETTARVVSERRLRLLRDLSDRTAAASDPDEVMAAAMTAFAAAPRDLAFVIGYRSGPPLRRGHAIGVDATTAAAIDAVVHSIDAPDAVIALPAPVSRDTWPEPATTAYLTRLRSGGAVVYGLSPRLPFDAAYRDLCAQLSEHIDAADAVNAAWRARAAMEVERNNLLMQAPVATALLVGPDHRYELANERYLRIVGRPVVGKAYTEAFPELIGSEVVETLDRVYRTGVPYVSEELLIPLDWDRDGTLQDRYFQFNIEPLRDDSERVYGMMAVAIDLTEQVRARQAMERAHAEREALLVELQQASRAKDEFLAMLGHELRNPLSPIVTAVELLRLRAGAPPRELDVIQRQVRHLSRLVDDLLDVSRIARGQVTLAREPVEVAAAVARALETTRPLIEAGRHDVTVAIAPGLVVDADPTRLAQVFANLLSNAAKYTPPHGRVEIAGERDGAWVTVRVRDTGVGIAEDMLPRIFELFTQAHQDLARAHGGLGLGLAIVKSLTELHGGTVAAASRGRGHGSVFSVRLPATQGAVAAATVAAHAAEVQRGAGMRVLLVDDNRDAALTLAEALRASGYQVEVAHDGAEALATAHERVPDVALLDIGLPEMDGYALAGAFRGDPRLAGVRLVALTGYGQLSDRTRTSAAGFDDHLVKPVSLALVTRTLDRVVAAVTNR